MRLRDIITDAIGVVLLYVLTYGLIFLGFAFSPI